jgi:hypothetical protein
MMTTVGMTNYGVRLAILQFEKIGRGHGLRPEKFEIWSGARASGLAIIHIVAGIILDSLNPHAKASRIFRLKLSRISAGNNVSPPTLKLRRKAQGSKRKA